MLIRQTLITWDWWGVRVVVGMTYSLSWLAASWLQIPYLTLALAYWMGSDRGTGLASAAAVLTNRSSPVSVRVVSREVPVLLHLLSKGHRILLKLLCDTLDVKSSHHWRYVTLYLAVRGQYAPHGGRHFAVREHAIDYTLTNGWHSTNGSTHLAAVIIASPEHSSSSLYKIDVSRISAILKWSQLQQKSPLSPLTTDIVGAIPLLAAMIATQNICHVYVYTLHRTL